MATTHVVTDENGLKIRPHAHHFESEHDEFEAAKQGMWIFLVTEVLMLGGMFVGYLIFRGMYLDVFAEAHKFLDWKLGATNTVILLTSSLTMVLGVTSTQRGDRTKALRYLALTLVLACGFLVVKYFEYSHKIHVGLLPGGLYTNTELTHPKAPIFFSLYFVMTGLHGLHVLIGMGLILWVFFRVKARELHQQYFTPVEMVGFYWHFVDLVWIYLFPLLYLVS
jgi:cytochrome c oxidase subunit 3